jgi:cysteine synthase
MNRLLTHLMLQRMNPAHSRLVRVVQPLPATLNPFVDEGVIITPALLYGDTFNSKTPVAYTLVAGGIAAEAITPETTVVTASSGNTGLGIALVCKALNLKCEIVMQNDTPAQKVGVISVLGNPVNTVLVSSGTIAYARDRGSQPGFFNADQYGDRDGNRGAQKTHLAPQLWGTHGNRIDIVVVPSGTLGTASGLMDYAAEQELSTTVVLALCADGEEVPAARDEARIRRDVTIASLEEFPHRMYATGYQSFLASYSMFGTVEWTPGGPTSGLALSAALRFIQAQRDRKTLDQFRGADGMVRVVFLCPDEYRPYGDLYRRVLKGSDFTSPFTSHARLLETV